MNDSEFEHAIEMLRSTDAITYEEAYHWLQGDNLKRYIPEIVDLLDKEEDPDVRAKLVELVGDADLEKYIPVLVRELSHASREVRLWAYNQLSLSSHEEAKEQAATYQRSHPDEDFY